MLNSISYVPDIEKNLTVKCLECGSERIEAFQCSCGKKFCRGCNPNSFEQEEFGDTLQVTCPSCGAITLFV
jgi:DNA-directed RNA polymerase subunit RPC12/RpoP